jgi:hypothetical protein
MIIALEMMKYTVHSDKEKDVLMNSSRISMREKQFLEIVDETNIATNFSLLTAYHIIRGGNFYGEACGQ